MDGKYPFLLLDGDNYNAWAVQMADLLHNKGLWMYLEKSLPAVTDDNYDLICLKNDESLYWSPYMWNLILSTIQQQKCKASLGFLPRPV